MASQTRSSEKRVGSALSFASERPREKTPFKNEYLERVSEDVQKMYNCLKYSPRKHSPKAASIKLESSPDKSFTKAKVQ